MIRASLGTWASYATTVAFQILFAASFGTSADASAFAIAFSLAVSSSGTFVTTALTVLLPRMLTEEGHFARRALVAMAGMAVIGLSSALVLAAITLVAADPAVESLGVPGASGPRVLLIAAALLAVLTIAGLLGVVALARGHRFLPAVAPAMPSTAGAIYLLLAPMPQVSDALMAMVVGGVAQGLLLGWAALLPRRRVIDTPPLGSRMLAAWTFMLFAALNLLAPLQRIIASTMDASGAAQYDYAARGLQVGLQILIGGLVISSLPDWSLLRRDLANLRSQVTRAVALALFLLTVAASVAVVAIDSIVAFVFERGAFGPADTSAVSTIVMVLLVGFMAEGFTLVATQALLAAKLTRQFLRINLARFVVQAILTVALGVTYGALGVAAAYSFSLGLTAALTGATAWRSGLVDGGAGLLARTAFVSCVALATAVVLAIVADEVAWISAMLVILLSVGAASALRLSALVPEPLRRFVPRSAKESA